MLWIRFKLSKIKLKLVMVGVKSGEVWVIPGVKSLSSNGGSETNRWVDNSCSTVTPTWSLYYNTVIK